MKFLENFYHHCIDGGFQLIGQENVSLSEAAGYTLGKEEGTALYLLQATDLTRLDMSICLFLRDKELERAEALKSMYSNIWVIFLWIGENPLIVEETIEEAESYYGQSPYAIYWHVNPDTQEMSVQEGQPDDIIGIKSIIQASIQSPMSDMPESAIIEKEEIHSSFPFCTLTIALANILVLILMYWQGFAQNPSMVGVRFGAIVPSLIWGEGEYYRLFTAIFVHFGWMHLFFNVAGMLIFGTRIEKYYGKFSFLAIYLVSGLSASVASLLLTQGFSAGASGAVYGLVGAAFVYTKFTGKAMDKINNHVIVFYIVMGLGMGFIMPNIDYFGHIGGLIAGLLVGFAALKLQPGKE